MTHNFYAGPAILPQEVFQKSAEAVINFEGTGLSILEISHRSKEFSAVMENAEQLVVELLEIPDNYKVLFLTGGASSQFFMAPMNLLKSNESAGYVDTGSWSTKAIKEANHFGNVELVATSKDTNYTYIPKILDINPNYKYLHITTNNTIFGTQYQIIPNTNIPLVADMSSEIFSRKLDINKYDLIYAGAQKNLGPAGVTLAIVNKEKLGKVDRDIPTMLDYQTHIKKDSSFNTPPVFPIYASMLSLEWLKNNGGIDAAAKRNDEKASLLYDAIDQSKLFNSPIAKEDRSKMNVVFTFENKDLESEFLKDCDTANCVGIKGHRSVGGFRASIYNAMPRESVEVLADVIQNFDRKHG